MFSFFAAAAPLSLSAAVPSFFLRCCVCCRGCSGSCRQLGCVFVVCFCCKMLIGTSPCVFEKSPSASSSSCVVCVWKTTLSHVIIAFHFVFLVTAHRLSYSVFCHPFTHIFNYLLSYCLMSVKLEGSVKVGCDHDLMFQFSVDANPIQRYFASYLA